MNADAITVSTTVHAPVERAWQAWTQPEHITSWNFASDDWHCPSASNDLRVGGAFSSRMAAKDGSMAFDFGGEHSEVFHLDRIASRMGDGRLMEVRFERISDAETRVTETFEPEGTNPAELQQAGWGAILENYRKYAESLQP